MADWFIATEGVKVVKDSASVLPQVLPVLTAVGGAILGYWLNNLNSKKAEKRKQKSEQVVIGAQLIIRLEEFELEFSSVAEDDGDYFPCGAGYDERKPVCFARELAFGDIQGNWAV